VRSVVGCVFQTKAVSNNEKVGKNLTPPDPLNKMPKYWMINDRSNGGVGPDVNFDGVTYWVSDKQPLTDINNWRKVTPANFQKLLVAAADKFPAHSPAENEKQSHVTILVHGFNNKFASAARFMRTFAANFLMVQTVSAFAFCTIGHLAAALWAMSRIVRMRAFALMI
jgi:hypothetical protein